MASVEFEGLDTLMLVIQGLPENMRGLSAGEMYQVASDVFNESQKQVPVRYGALRGSGHITPPDNTGEIDIGYGGTAAGYALWVHENLAAHHAPPTKAKYLEDPMNQFAPELEGRLGSEVDAAIVGQYPQQPSMAAGAAAASGVRTSGSRRRNIARSQAMTDSEIHRALERISERHLNRDQTLAISRGFQRSPRNRKR